MPVRHSSISSRTASWSPTHGRWSSPARSTSFAPGICSARYRASSVRTTRSPFRCRMSVGTRIADRIGRTSISAFIRARVSGGLRARALHEVRGPEPHEALVVRGARSASSATHRSAPALLDLPERGGQVLIGLAPRIVGRSLPARVTAVHDERHRALGVGGGEQRAHRAALRDAEERRALRADGVQHRPDVVHPLLEGGQLLIGNPIGKARASLVEQDQTGEGCEPREEPRVGRFLPVQSDVRDPAGHVDEIERTVPDHLIGDMRIAAPGEPRLRSLHPAPLGGQRTPVTTGAPGVRGGGGGGGGGEEGGRERRRGEGGGGGRKGERRGEGEGGMGGEGGEESERGGEGARGREGRRERGGEGRGSWRGSGGSSPARGQEREE